MKALLFTFLFTFLSPLLISCSLIGGASKKDPFLLTKDLSPEATALIDSAFSGLPGDTAYDYHTHLVGNSSSNGTYVNEEWLSLTHPKGYLMFKVYKSASGVSNNNKLDEQYLERLTSLISSHPYPVKYGLMAFDYNYSEAGAIRKKHSTFQVSNAYMMKVVQQHPDLFFPIISIHPYRLDAIAELERYGAQGVRFVKWLPNSMNINPASKTKKPMLDAYYETMKKFDMVLITHTGDEKATEGEEAQRYGNPQYLYAPLDKGVKVVMAHVASLGSCTEEPCGTHPEYLISAIDLLKDPRYDGLLYADISAITQANRLHSIDAIIENTAIHPKLINGSDYPLPAINIIIRTSALVKSGHITKVERELLNEIFDYNPLLFDFVLKRTIKHSVTGHKLPSAVFGNHAF
ncbi:MAG: amidohydrolase family protein [Fibrobacterales bacterium]